MYYLQLHFLLLVSSIMGQYVPNNVEFNTGYCWKDYFGMVPSNALPGGRATDGGPSFIGQAYFPQYGVLPASIYYGNPEAISSYATTIRTRQFIKILCVDRPEMYQWIAVHIDSMHLLTPCHLVIGGYQHNFTVYIGRVNFNDEIVIGKVLNVQKQHKGLWIPTRDGRMQFDSFEILAYDCKLSPQVLSRLSKKRSA